MPAASKKASRSRASRSTSRFRPPRLGLLALAVLVGLSLYVLFVEDPLGLFTAPPNPAAQSGPAAIATRTPAGWPTPRGSYTPFIPRTDTPTAAPAATNLPPEASPLVAVPPLPTLAPGPAATAPPTTAAPAWWEVYFSDPNTVYDPQQITGSIEERLLAYIGQAQSSIHVAAFEFNLDRVADALIAAHRRGVDVRWITDDEYGLEADEEPGRGQFARLHAAGIPIKADNRRALMHNKFIIFDYATVWTGSTNLTVNDNYRNNNNTIVIHSPALADVYEEQFASMWAGEFGQRSPSDLDAQALVIRRTPVQVLFSPEDNAIPFLIPYLQRAEESIRFMAFSFTHNGMTEAMLERARAGVEVRGIFETRGSQTPYSALAALFCARLPVRQDGNPRSLHHKVIVIDRRLVITGSLNFSDNANEPNNENTLIITSRGIADLYLKEFERRWAEATHPDPVDFLCPR